MNKDLSRKRQQDLKANILETLDLIKQYEDKRRLSEDPREQRECDRQLADLQQLLAGYRKELAKLEKITQAQTALWPFSIPDERYYPLPGRERDLEYLLGVLQDPQGAPFIVVDGLGGLGKTALAVELARRALHLGLFEGVVGDSAKQELFTGGEIVQLREATLDFDGLLDAIARQLGRWELPTFKAEEKQAALSYLLQQKRYLVLVDNLETTENANTLVVHLRGLLGSSRAVVTSRKRVRHDFVCPLSLRGLDTADSLFFLRTDAEQRGVRQILEAAEEKLIEIHKIIGGAPLALKLVVAQAAFLDLGLILGQLQQASGDLYPFIFHQGWTQLSPAAQRALVYIGRTVVTTVGWEELSSVGIAEDERTLTEAIDQLIAYSLLDASFAAGQMRYGIHQLTRHFVTGDLPKIWEQQGLL
jgi:LuxR family glucitol operon transcriptional activator